MAILTLSDSELKTLRFYLEQAKIDVEGMHAIGIADKQSVLNIRSLIGKAQNPENSDWNFLIKLLEESPKHFQRFDTNSDGEILCRTSEDAECIADFLEAIGFDVVHTSCDDETSRNGWKWHIYPD